MRLELLNKDVVVLEYEYDEELHAVTGVARLVAPEFAPPACVSGDGSVTAADLAWWWRHRGIPASRPRLERLLETVGLDSVSELVERAMALSLSDRYWARPVGSELRWSDVNFFDNDFSSDLGELTIDPLGGEGSGSHSDDDLMSPNSTVLGNVPKKWVRLDDGSLRLLKAGVQLYDQDVRNELVACSLYGRLLAADEYVPYEVVRDVDRELSSCPNMLGEDEELVSAADLIRRHRRESGFGTYRSVVEALCETGLGRPYIERCLSKLFSCDYLMANFDRHLGNFGLIRDCMTLRYKGFAPFYDCGNALWCGRRRLSEPSSYDYRPMPFLGGASESPERQLRLFTDYAWLGYVDLDTWIKDALMILSEGGLIPAERLERIRHGMELHVRNFWQHVDKCARL